MSAAPSAAVGMSFPPPPGFQLELGLGDDDYEPQAVDASSSAGQDGMILPTRLDPTLQPSVGPVKHSTNHSGLCGIWPVRAVEVGFVESL